MTAGNEAPWGGRFQRPTAEETLAFTESTAQDAALFEEDIRGSRAHARMLAATGLISKEDADRIVSGLESLLADWRAGKIQLDPRREDVHMNIERLLEERIGEPARRLHTGRSRNDQVATDFRLYTRNRIVALRLAIRTLGGVLCRLAYDHADWVMPGYTHLQRAQPITLGHHLLAYAEMLWRDDGRFADAYVRAGESPLGAGALAGTSLPIDREQTARELGFDRPAANSLDAVADRDFALEFLAACAILMMHLSRLAEELVLWSTREFGFLVLDDAYATGSSMLPQKKNPDIPELVRGRTGRVYGHLVSLLVTMKALPLAYNRDLQEDKIPVQDAALVCESSLRILAGLLDASSFQKERLAEAASDRNLCATDLAEYLVEKGVPFREAHRVVGSLVGRLGDLNRAEPEDLRKASPLFEDASWSSLNPEAAVKRRRLVGGPAPDNVRRRARELRRVFETAPTPSQTP